MLIFLTLGNFLNSSYSPLAPFIKTQFALNSVEVGLITSAIFIGSMTVSFISGFFVDRLGPFNALKMAFGLMSLGALIIVFSQSYFMLIFGYYFIGFGYGIVTPSTNSSIMKEYKGNHASKMGIKQAGVPVGATLSAIVLTLVALHFTLLSAFISILIVAVAIFIIMPREKGHVYSREIGKGYFSDFLKGITNRSLVFVSGTIIFMSWAQQSLLTFFALFEESKGFGIEIAELLLITMLIGSTFGRLFWGFMGDRMLGGSRIKMLSLIIALSGILFLVLNLTDHFFAVAAAIAFLIGMNAIGWNSTYVTIVSEIAPKTKVGLFSGISFVIIGLGTIVGTPISGAIHDSTSYTVLWTVLGFALIIVSLLFATIGSRYFKGIDGRNSSQSSTEG